MKAQSGLTYRPDIDGLRAVSVLSVLLFHFGLTRFSGGFVGVDMFFVISGFLITKILHRETLDGTFSLAAFYERRIKRIFPAMLAVLVATLAAGALILWPADFAGLARSAMFSVAGAANLYFYWHTGYFDLAAHMQPLLHFWSLAVEEQFYVVWPAIIYFGTSRTAGTNRRIAAVVAAVIVVSLAAAVVQVPRNPSAAFYLPHLRAWELALGALLTFVPAGAAWRRSRELAAALGLALIAYSVFTLTERDAFPGLNAVPPTLGAALFIWAGAGGLTLIGRALAVAPVRFIGLISYSLYLWHWPIIVFYRQITGREHPPGAHIAALTVGAIVLAALTWRYVEQPFRKRGGVFGRRRVVFTAGIGAALCVMATAGVVVRADGFQGRLDAQVSKVLAYTHYYPKKEFRVGQCFQEPGGTAADFDRAECIPAPGQKSVMLWGDSTVAQYYWGIKEPLKAAGYAVGQITASSCPPLLGKVVNDRPNCKAINDFAIEQIQAARPTIVVLGAMWPLDAASYAQFQDTVARIQSAGSQVVVMGNVPRFPDRVPTLLAARMSAAGSHADMGVYDIAKDGDLLFSNQILADWVAKQPGARFVSPVGELCPGGMCPILSADGLPFYYDGVHLTDVGAVQAGAILGPRLITGVN